VMIPNALQPAEISEVMLYSLLGRAVVLVAEDQLSLAIGRRGQNVRLASKLVGWDIEIMTHEELGESVEKAERWFSGIPGSSPELAELLITEGLLSFTDVTFLEPTWLAEAAGCTEEEADEMILYAEEMSEKIEREGEPEFERPAAEPAASASEAETVVEGESPGEEGEQVAEPVIVDEQTPNETAAPTDFHSLFNHDDSATAEQPPPGTEEVPPEQPATP
jgi:transcription termination/antitermination protein NusA